MDLLERLASTWTSDFMVTSSLIGLGKSEGYKICAIFQHEN